MDSGTVPGLGWRSCAAVWIHRRISPGGQRGCRSRVADTDGSIHEVKITIPELSLVVLIGPSGSGKSTFARTHFKATEVLSSDACRGLVSDDENNQAATKDAFDVLHFIGAKRLAAAKLTVVDATNVQGEARKPLVALAREYHCSAGGDCLRSAGEAVPGAQPGSCRSHLWSACDPPSDKASRCRSRCAGWSGKGFAMCTCAVSSPEEVQAVTGSKTNKNRFGTNRRAEHGPFDIIGDVHGCYDELVELLANLGYAGEPPGEEPGRHAPPGAEAGLRR